MWLWWTDLWSSQTLRCGDAYMTQSRDGISLASAYRKSSAQRLLSYFIFKYWSSLTSSCNQPLFKCEYLQPKSSYFLSWCLAPIQPLTPNTCIRLSHQATTRFGHQIHSLRILASFPRLKLRCLLILLETGTCRCCILISTRLTKDQATRHGFHNSFDAPLRFNHCLKLLGTAAGAN